MEGNDLLGLGSCNRIGTLIGLIDVEIPRFSLAEEGHCLRIYLQTSAVRLLRMVDGL
jgi:hypothetical protein